MFRKIGETDVEIKKGDITLQSTDAIVNAANSQLAHIGGVARAIASKAGPELIDASINAPEIKTGDVHTTPGGNLNSKYVIHAVGPIWKNGNHNEEDLLTNAIQNSLKEADRLKTKSISFPAISTGIYGFPIDLAARTILYAIKDYFEHNKSNISLVVIVLFTQEDFELFVKYSTEILH